MSLRTDDQERLARRIAEFRAVDTRSVGQRVEEAQDERADRLDLSITLESTRAEGER
jgi:hypothetical protein